jgi:hypothetical protein
MDTRVNLHPTTKEQYLAVSELDSQYLGCATLSLAAILNKAVSRGLSEPPQSQGFY